MVSILGSESASDEDGIGATASGPDCVLLTSKYDTTSETTDPLSGTSLVVRGCGQTFRDVLWRECGGYWGFLMTKESKISVGRGSLSVLDGVTK